MISWSPQFVTHLATTVFPLIEAGSQIQAGSLIEAGGQTSFPPIEARSLIQARSLIEAGGLKDEYHRTNCASPPLYYERTKFRL